MAAAHPQVVAQAIPCQYEQDRSSTGQLFSELVQGIEMAEAIRLKTNANQWSKEGGGNDEKTTRIDPLRGGFGFGHPFFGAGLCSG
jgi:hypothetical protein